jgi:uncharacterized protein YjbJ (UPF0337 family)
MNNYRLNRDQFKCDWPQFKGELQKNWKDFSDEDLTEVEGDYDRFVSLVQKRCRDKEEEIVRWELIGTRNVSRRRLLRQKRRYQKSNVKSC